MGFTLLVLRVSSNRSNSAVDGLVYNNGSQLSAHYFFKENGHVI
jgi:hypothetical protein